MQLRFVEQWPLFVQHAGKDTMDNQVRVAPDRRREVRIRGCREREMPGILVTVTRLLQRSQHQVAQNALFRLAGDFRNQALVVA